MGIPVNHLMLRMGINIEKRVIEAFNGLSVKKIAESLGYSYTTFRNWIRGDREPPLKELIRIAKMGNVSVDWLLTGEESKSRDEVQIFDIEDSIKQHDSWRGVLQDWYKFEGREMPQLQGASFMNGWDSFSYEMKIAAVEDLKKVLDLTAADNE